jgi:uncharacterized protein YggE
MDMNTEEGKRILKWAGIAVIVLTAFLAVETLGALKNLRGVNPAYNSISITGEGDVVAVPDVAAFSFTVASDGKTVSEAQTAVTTKMDAILAELKAQGVEDKDIKTTDYTVYPKYSYTASVPCSPTYCPPTRQVADGYTATHNVTVKVRNTDNAGKVLGAVGDKGATGLSGISFTQDDPNKATSEARTAAIKDARNKAQTLAKDLGVRLVRVVSYYDNTVGQPMPYNMALGGADVTKSSVPPTIPIGENKTKVSVTVTYEIR